MATTKTIQLHLAFGDSLAPVMRALDGKIPNGVRMKGAFWTDGPRSGLFLTGERSADSFYRHSLKVLLCWPEKEMAAYLSAPATERDSMAEGLARRISALFEAIERTHGVDFHTLSQQHPNVVVASVHAA